MLKPAPLIFLLGTSTAGKSTICDEILRQDQASENLGFETWGLDAEAENEMVRCRDLPSIMPLKILKKAFQRFLTWCLIQLAVIWSQILKHI